MHTENSKLKAMAGFVSERCEMTPEERMKGAIPISKKLSGYVSLSMAHGVSSAFTAMSVATLAIGAMGGCEPVRIASIGLMALIALGIGRDKGHEPAAPAPQKHIASDDNPNASWRWRDAIGGIVNRIRDSESVGGEPISKEELNHSCHLLMDCARQADQANSRRLAFSNRLEEAPKEMDVVWKKAYV